MPYTDSTLYRVKILYNDTSACAGGLVIIDAAGAIIDRKGNFVWFLPPDTGLNLQPGRQYAARPSLNDLRMTATGTFTMLNEAIAEERDLQGRILWQAPLPKPEGSSIVPDTAFNYHHCFKKLANGDYMVLDREKRLRNLPVPADAATGTGKVIIEDEIIREFDAGGKQVWKWSSEDYFDSLELQQMLLTGPDWVLIDKTPGGHMNAFDVDEKNHWVYASFRNVSRVVKIDMKTWPGALCLGQGCKDKRAKQRQGLFCQTA